MDAKKWFSETSRRRVTDGMIAEILDVTRKTANKRINDGLPMDDLVTISRALEVNPVVALVELGHITHSEVEDYLDSDGQLIDTADDGVLALALARRLNPATRAPEIDELAKRRSITTTPDVGDVSNNEANNERRARPEAVDNDLLRRINSGEEPVAAQEATKPIEEDYT